MAVEIIPLSDLSRVHGPGEYPVMVTPPLNASGVSERSRQVAQELIDRLAYLETNTPAPGSPWPAWRARLAKKVFGQQLPDYFTYFVSVREAARWIADWGPLATSVWVMRIEAEEPLPLLEVQRIDGQPRYYGHHTNRHMLQAARLKGLASLECEVTTF